ncbi:MAG: hypothetical protein AB9873_05075 [Syntrophobacteraceae bacterium]
MEVKMPVKFHATYAITTRCGGQEKRERCQKLSVNELSPEAREKAFGNMPEVERPTHQITFYDFGCKRILNGTLTGNEEDKLLLQVQDKEYEFKLYNPSR